MRFRGLVVGLLCFLGGFASALAVCAYASSVWTYNARISVREELVDSSVQRFSKKRFSEAAVLMEAANHVASTKDEVWPFLFPLRALVMRASGSFDYIRVSDNYRKQEIAFLYQQAGDEEAASRYYLDIEHRQGRDRSQVDKSAAAFLSNSVR